MLTNHNLITDRKKALINKNKILDSGENALNVKDIKLENDKEEDSCYLRKTTQEKKLIHENFKNQLRKNN